MYIVFCFSCKFEPVYFLYSVGIHSDGVDMQVVLLNIDKQLSRQEAITDHLLARMHTLEEATTQNHALLTRVQDQLCELSSHLLCSKPDNGRSLSALHSLKYSCARTAGLVSSDSEGPSQMRYIHVLKKNKRPLKRTPPLKKSLPAYFSNSSDASSPLFSANTHKSCAQPKGKMPRSVGESFLAHQYGSSSTSVSGGDSPTCSEYFPDGEELIVDGLELIDSGLSGSPANSRKPPPKSQQVTTMDNKSQGLLSSSPPLASPIVLAKNRECVLSSEIDKSSLLPVDEIIAKYGHKNPPFLASKLARLAFFGPRILARCTPMGQSAYLALPLAEMSQIKQIVLNNYPGYWDIPQEYEELWKSKIVSSIGSECTKARARKSRQQGVQCPGTI